MAVSEPPPQELDFDSICKAIDDDFHPPGYDSSDDDGYSYCETPQKEDDLATTWKDDQVDDNEKEAYIAASESDNKSDSVSHLNCEKKAVDSTFLDVTASTWTESEDLAEGDDAKEQYSSTSSGSEKERRTQDRFFCLNLASNVWFLIGSVFYVWLAFMDLQWMKSIQDIPDWVLQADDDYSWADYPIEDDYIFETGKGVWVSQSQIVYAVAATCFVIVGFIDLFAYPSIVGVLFILAGTFGLLSACYQETNERLSYVFNAVSVHLYLSEAVGLLCRRAVMGRLFQRWIRLGDLLFVVATGIDCGLSYTYIFDTYTIKLAKLGISASFFWLTTSLIYVAATLYGKKHNGAIDSGESVHSIEKERAEQARVWDDDELSFESL